MNKTVKYLGEWQQKSVILEKLEGPIGEGCVEFPNGDKFEGYFHLSFAQIQGPCYVANGKYTFADGKYIENAWINTSDNLKWFGLKGVYEVRYTDGSLASITSFLLNKRHGIEVQVVPAVKAVEWYDGEEQKHYEVKNYTLNAIDNDRRQLMVELADGVSVEMTSGRLVANRFDNYIYENYLSGKISCANGDEYLSVNYNIRNLQPYEGSGTRRMANGMKRDEYYKGYELERIEREGWDRSKVEEKQIPNPINPEELITAYVWSNHIEYDYPYNMMYDGDVVDGMPHGQGVLSDARSQAYIDGKPGYTWRFTYEGTFAQGRCNGNIVFTDHEKNVVKESKWENGLSVGVAPVKLRYEWKCKCEDETDIRTGEVEVRLGMKLSLGGFDYVRVLDMTQTYVQFNVCEPLCPGGAIYCEKELTYDLAYNLKLSWNKE